MMGEEGLPFRFSGVGFGVGEREGGLGLGFGLMFLDFQFLAGLFSSFHVSSKDEDEYEWL